MVLVLMAGLWCHCHGEASWGLSSLPSNKEPSTTQNEPKTLADFQLSGQLSCQSTPTTPCITRLNSVSQVDCWSALLAQDKDIMRDKGGLGQQD